MRTQFLALALLSAFAASAHAEVARPAQPAAPRPAPALPRFATYYVSCESNGYNLNTCLVNGAVVQARVIQQNSFAACTLGQSFGFRGNSIWVNRGCRATLAVTVRR